MREGTCPREAVRIETYERPPWEWTVPMLRIHSGRHKGYDMLATQDNVEATFSHSNSRRGRKRRTFSEQELKPHLVRSLSSTDLERRESTDLRNTWADSWIEVAEQGELDVYTCLGLSNAFTWTPDTQKLIAKVMSVTILQVILPCIMLNMELATGVSYKPRASGFSFRLIGSALFGYSVFTMYNNASDECRTRMLKFSLENGLTKGHWAPLLLGEFSNVLVSLILVLTLYCIYAELTRPVDLILNAVAVNFLGSVDAEFVNQEMKQDALSNFKKLMSEFSKEDASDHQIVAAVTEIVLRIMLAAIWVSGSILAVLFMFAPAAELELKTTHTSGRGNR